MIHRVVMAETDTISAAATADSYSICKSKKGMLRRSLSRSAARLLAVVFPFNGG